MLVNLLYKKCKIFIQKANSYGLPVPLIHDPKAGQASVSLTLVFISSLLVIIGIVGKWSKVVGEIDMKSAMEFFYASSALYFSRKWQQKTSKTDTASSVTPDNPDSPAS